MSRIRMPSLGEIIVVGFTIVVLAALLFPVVAIPRDPHNFCLSNEKQLGLAMIQYAQDNNETLPVGAHSTGIGWGGKIYPYVKCVGTYRCPDDPTPVAGANPVVSYGMNSNAAQHPLLSKYATPAQTVLLFEVAGVKANIMRPDERIKRGAMVFSAAGDGTDGTLNAGHATPKYATGDLGSRPNAASSQFDAPRHKEGSNFLFSDGHTKWFLPNRISSGTDAMMPTDGQTGVTHGTAAGTQDTAFGATFSVK
jgi:prepilin-type processing-associated H-X9-DG protein